MDVDDPIYRAQAGESFAWNLLFKRHYPWLYALALRHCSNLTGAQDAVQETFVSAFLKLHQLKDPEAFPAWIKTILVRQCLRMRDADTTESSLALDQHPRGNFVELAEEEVAATKLHCLLETLPEVLRSVLLLRYFSGWQTYEHIAEILGIPIGTVRSRLNQAKTKLMQGWKVVPVRSDPFSHADEWNEFYTHHFSNLYTSMTCRDNFLEHLNKNIQIRSGGTLATGRRWIEQEIEGDIVHGSYFREVHVVGSGNISVVELTTENSGDHPDRCPSQSVIVLFRDNRKVEKLHLYSSR